MCGMDTSNLSLRPSTISRRTSTTKGYWTSDVVRAVAWNGLRWRLNASALILARNYMAIGTAGDAMRYVAAHAERIPFSNGYFDIISCLNALDHVDHFDRTNAEIKRVTKTEAFFWLASKFTKARLATRSAFHTNGVKTNTDAAMPMHYEIEIQAPRDSGSREPSAAGIQHGLSVSSSDFHQALRPTLWPDW